MPKPIKNGSKSNKDIVHEALEKDERFAEYAKDPVRYCARFRHHS